MATIPGFISPFLNPDVLFGAGGTGILGFVGGHLKARSAKITHLEREVKECHDREALRDADFRVICAGVRVMAGELKRERPDSIALAMCGDLLNRKLGPAPTIDDLRDLLSQVDQADERTDDGMDR